METRLAIAVLAIALIAGGGLRAQTAPAKVDGSKFAGAWQLEVDADGTYYYLGMSLLDKSGKLEGTISEASGYFKDVPLAEVVFDGEKLIFKFNAPTPPDGVSREVGAEFRLVQGALDGVVRVPELGVSAPAKGTRDTSGKS